MAEKILEGKLLCYSETGMEGGYLSIQDVKYITLQTPTFGITDGRKVYDKIDNKRFGISSNLEVFLENNWLQLPDPSSA